jgi:LPS export ABC transporter protein LptC
MKEGGLMAFSRFPALSEQHLVTRALSFNPSFYCPKKRTCSRTMKGIATYCCYFCMVVLFACGRGSDDAMQIQEYTGPIFDIGPSVNYYSDSAVVRMRMEAPRQLVFANEDSEYPEGLYMEFFEKGKMTSTLRADYCYYTKKEDLYKATGNVVIQSMQTKDRLDTEELYWSQKKEEVFTDKFVKIEQDGYLHLGEGLEAKQDFSYWKILDAQGTIPLNREQ